MAQNTECISPFIKFYMYNHNSKKMFIVQKVKNKLILSNDINVFFKKLTSAYERVINTE